LSETPEHAIVVKNSAAELIPADATERLVKTLRGFEKLKRDGLRVSDFAIIQGKKHVKKSGCSLLAAICGVSTQKLDERVEDLPNAERLYHFTYRGIAPNGRFADAVGSASTKEKQFTHPHHDARTLAQTRAYNRSILNLVAAGEVSAEEMISETHEETGTSATVESPVPPEVSPAPVTEKKKNETRPTESEPLPSETEISVHKPEERVAHYDKEKLLVHKITQETVGKMVISEYEDHQEFDIQSTNGLVVDLEKGPFKFLQGCLDGFKRKHPEFKSEIRVNDQGVLTGIWITTSKLSDKIIDLDIVSPTVWTFNAVLHPEKTKDTQNVK
jgi:hypothetical protein